MISTQIHFPTLFLCQQSPGSVQVFSAPLLPYTHTPSDCSGLGILSSAPGEWILLSDKTANSNCLISDQIGRSLLDLSKDTGEILLECCTRFLNFHPEVKGASLEE